MLLLCCSFWGQDFEDWIDLHQQQQVRLVGVVRIYLGGSSNQDVGAFFFATLRMSESDILRCRTVFFCKIDTLFLITCKLIKIILLISYRSAE